MASSSVKDFLVTYLMPEKCYERIFVNFHMSVPCLQFVMNRIFGILIILETFLAQLPQLLKILWRRSAEGLSLTSMLLQLYAFSCPVVYAMANNYPLFAWAERLFTLAQTAAIVFLILHYRGHTLSVLYWSATLWCCLSTCQLHKEKKTMRWRARMLFLLAYGAAMFLLGSYAAAAVVSVMQASSLAALITSKVLQAGTNHRHGHTGQLSSLSVLLSWAGSLGVLFVSLQETGSLFTPFLQTLSAGVSCVLLAQVLCCRGSAATTKTKRE